jgi:hypothetical protein
MWVPKLASSVANALYVYAVAAHDADSRGH